jgi:hypothetical protein
LFPARKIALNLMSAFGGKADIVQHGGNVRFVPQADSCTAAILSLFDHPVGVAKPQLAGLKKPSPSIDGKEYADKRNAANPQVDSPSVNPK